MNKSREAICNILDEAILAFDEFEEEPFSHQYPVTYPILGSFVSRKDTWAATGSVKETGALNGTSAVGDNQQSVSEKPTKKRSWKKPTDKPKRPLSAYNLFFSHERDNIIAGGCSSLTADEILAKIRAKDNRQQPKCKRIHRKTHGKISFGNLARSIADKWKTLDKEKKAVFEDEAKREKIRYQKAVDEWKKQRNEKNEEVIPSAACEETAPHEKTQALPEEFCPRDDDAQHRSCSRSGYNSMGVGESLQSAIKLDCQYSCGIFPTVLHSQQIAIGKLPYTCLIEDFQKKELSQKHTFHNKQIEQPQPVSSDSGESMMPTDLGYNDEEKASTFFDDELASFMETMERGLETQNKLL